MAKRKRKRKRKNKRKYTSAIKLVPVETTEQLLSRFPKNLVRAFIKMKLSGFAEDEHKRYIKIVRKFLGKLKDDRIAQGELVVQLSRATSEMIKDLKKKDK